MDFILYSYNCILVFLSFWWQARFAAISTCEIFRGWQVEHLPQIAGQSAVEASSLQDLKIYSHSHTYFVEREVFKLIFTNLRFHKVFITRSQDIYSLPHTHFTLQKPFISIFGGTIHTLTYTHLSSQTSLHTPSQSLHYKIWGYSHPVQAIQARIPLTNDKRALMHDTGRQSLFMSFFRFHCY